MFKKFVYAGLGVFLFVVTVVNSNTNKEIVSYANPLAKSSFENSGDINKKANLNELANKIENADEITVAYRSTGCSVGCSSGCSVGCSSGCSVGCSSGCRRY